MRLNHRPSKVAFADFETQSSCDLREHTTHQYASDKSTRALTLCIKVDGTMHRFGPYLDAVAKASIAALTEGRTIVAHNAPFDAAVWELSEGLPAREWFDTLPCCRAAGYPGKLDEVSKILGLGGKDKNGKLLIDLLCIIKRGFIPPVGPAHKLLLDYNEKDVDDLEGIYNAVKDFGEPDVIEADRAVNDRGIPVDGAYLQKLKAMFDANTRDSRDNFTEKVGEVNPSSPKQMMEWLRKQGFNVPACNKVVWKSMLENPDKYFVGDGDQDTAFEVVREAMEIRREVVRVSGSKVDTALQILESDGRIREQHVYFGAHTGRWSGRALQVQNLPATSGLNNSESYRLSLDPSYEEAKAIAEAETVRRRATGEPACATSDVLASLLRPMVRSDTGLLFADYAAIELRGVAWLGDCSRMLNVLSDPSASIYLDMGEEVFGRRISKSDLPRYMFCKSLVLGCGYGMSGNKFEYICKLRNIKTSTLAEAGISAKDAVKLFRQTYPEIPAVWKAYGDAVLDTVRSREETYAGKCMFSMVGPDMHCMLPSGRPIVYRNARIELLVPGWQALYNMPERPMPTVVYDKPSSKFGKTGFLYGSKVAENVTQAICRDLLAYALVCAEQEGLQPVLHVHDELCCEQPEEKLSKLLEIMSAPPSWAEGFPLLIEGCAAPVWTKQTKGFKELKAMNGKML